MTLQTQSLHQVLDNLAAKQPTPGGGAVAGILAGLATALGNMVLAYSKGKQSLEGFHDVHDDCIAFLNAAKDEAMALGDADASAYEKVSRLWKLSKDDPKRIEHWDSSLCDATKIPIQTLELNQRILITLNTLLGKTNSMLSSDLAIAAILAEASARAAWWNVGVNTMQMECETQKNTFNAQANQLLETCKELSKSIEETCRV